MTTPPIELEVDELPTRQRHFRVAVVTETYPPEVNGVARSIACVVQGLQARDHAVQLLRPRQAPAGMPPAPDAPIDEVLMRGLAVPRYPHLRMGVVSKRTLINLWASKRPDIVHIATEGPMGWSALQAARQLKLPVVSEFRTNFHAYAQHYGIGWLRRPLLAYLRKFHNRCHSTMVPNATLAGELMAQGFRHVSVIARGVDTQLFHPSRRSDALRDSWGAAPGDPVLLHVGRLAAEKNLQLLVDLWPAVRQRHPRARLVLVGDGPARADFQQLLPPSSNVVFAGMKHGEDLAACYASGDLFAFPSITETYGNVTPEALASGLPVMAYQYAAAALLVRDGLNGGLAPFNDPAAFQARTLSLLEDLPRLRAMRLAARGAAESLDWDGIVQGIEQVYASAIDGTSVALRAGSQLSGLEARAH